MSATGMLAVHTWLGLQVKSFDWTQIASPASGTAGKSMPDVQPPVEAEYWVVEGTFVPATSRIMPDVYVTALSESGFSFCSPSYAWQSCESQMSAYPSHPPSAL